MLSNSVVTAPNPLEARFGPIGAGGQRCLDGFPEQRLARELASCRMYLARSHRLPGQFKHHRHCLEHRAYLGGSRLRFTRIGLGFAEQLVVERA